MASFQVPASTRSDVAPTGPSLVAVLDFLRKHNLKVYFLYDKFFLNFWENWHYFSHHVPKSRTALLCSSSTIHGHHEIPDFRVWLGYLVKIIIDQTFLLKILWKILTIYYEFSPKIYKTSYVSNSEMVKSEALIIIAGFGFRTTELRCETGHQRKCYLSYDYMIFEGATMMTLTHFWLFPSRDARFSDIYLTNKFHQVRASLAPNRGRPRIP